MALDFIGHHGAASQRDTGEYTFYFTARLKRYCAESVLPV
jgi:hypothetical protein